MPLPTESARTSFWRILARSAPLLVLLTALSVLAGWYAGARGVVAFGDALVAMPFNAALGLAAAALGVLAAQHDRRGWIYAGAGVAGLFGSLTLVEDLSGVSLGVDGLLWHLGVPRGAMLDVPTMTVAAPARMDPITAMALLLLAAGVVLAAGLSRERPAQPARRVAWLALVGSVVGGTGMATFIGYIGGPPSPHGWGNLTRMAMPTAGCLALLGVSLVAMAQLTMPAAQGLLRRYPWLVAVAGSMLTVGLWVALLDQQRAALTVTMTHAADVGALVVSEELRHTAYSVTRLSERWDADAALSASDSSARTAWRREAAAFMRDLPALNQLLWVSASGRDTLAVRGDGGLALTEPQRTTIARALDSATIAPDTAGRQWRVVSSKDLAVVAVRSAPGTRGAWTLAIVDARDIVATLRRASVGHGVALVRDGTPAAGSDTPHRVTTDLVVDAPVDIAGLHWSVRTFPESGMILGGVPPMMALLIGFLLTGLLTRALMLASVALARADDLAHVNVRLEEARKAADGANVAKSEFLSRMSHELRTPLNSVIGFAGVLLTNRKGNLTSGDLKYLDRIATNGRHLLGLINDILDLSKIEAGKLEALITPVALSRLVEDTLGELSGRMADGRVALVGDVPSGLDPFLTDEVKLKQIIINLVGNALKFTTAGTVTVRVVPDAAGRRAVRLDVMDTGIGIAPERLTAIFDAFEQADNETAVKYGGTGLGLSISRAFAALLGYRIVVRSTVGVGSIFSLLLDPIALVPPAPMGGEAGRVAVIDAATSAASEPLAVRALKNLPLVLVIDDSADSRAIVNDALLEANVEVMLATSGDEGLALARAYRPSVILLDLVMPGMTGWEVLGHLKTDPILSAIPVVIVSALAEREDSPFLGALDVVEKPIRRDVLLAAVRRHLAGLTRPHVMIVDDDIDVRNLLTITLREAGPCQIHEAENGVDALLQVERVTPDLFVLDLMMPEMNGFQLLQQLRRDPRFAVTPIIVVSAKDLSAPERALLARDTATLIQKGPDVDRLLQETLQALSRAV